MTEKLVEHFFRHEYGRLVAALSCRVGMQYVEDVEDAVQAALLSALEAWTIAAVPDNPSAWLFRVAHNNLMGGLRQDSGRRRILERNADDLGGETQQAQEPVFPDEIQDDMLRMMIACCDESIPTESQLVIALKTLCGFSASEIALRLFTSEANVYQRLGRARGRLRENPPRPQELTCEQCSSRMPAVHKVLYLMFTEGHLSSDHQSAIRHELCDDAIRLATVMAEHRAGQIPETHALLALMHLHVARMPARCDGTGGLFLLEEQDRKKWDARQIQVGLEWLAKSAAGDNFSRYHAEAAVAAEHCVARSFTETRWDRVAECYEMLEQIAPSPIHRLNRALAVAQSICPAAGLAIVEDCEAPSWLTSSYLWAAVLADLHRRCGNTDLARRYREQACESAPTKAIRDLLERRLQIEEET